MKISEIFYSIQGEGARSGEASLFVRLQGCSAKMACYASGIRCDTDFESGKEIANEELLERLRKLSERCNWIIWTGGEPTDQLTAETVAWFKEKGYKQAIETSGLNAVPHGIDFITISPKVAEHVILKRMPIRTDGTHCDEVRWVRHAGQFIPATQIKAHHYFLSPHFDGIELNTENTKHCIQLCMENPNWKVSIQIHKLLNLL